MSLESIPTYFSDFMDISLEAGQAILSIVVILAVLIPIMYLSSKPLVEIVMLVLTEAFLVGIGWLPFWLLIATVAAMAFGVAALGTKAVMGG